jgi:ATP-binding cassette subfamily B protein
LLKGDRRRVGVLTPDRAVIRRPASAIVGATDVEVDRLLDLAGLRGSRRARARDALLREGMSPDRLQGGWILRPGVVSTATGQARELGLPQLAAALLAAHAVQSGLWLLSWWLLGWIALAGRFERGWLLAWLLLLLTLVPLRLATT